MIISTTMKNHTENKKEPRNLQVLTEEELEEQSRK